MQRFLGILDVEANISIYCGMFGAEIDILSYLTCGHPYTLVLCVRTCMHSGTLGRTCMLFDNLDKESYVFWPGERGDKKACLVRVSCRATPLIQKRPAA